MTTRIYYTDKDNKVYCLFDIEYYCTKAVIKTEEDMDYKEQTWHLELHVYTDPRGIAHFSMDHAENKELMGNFIFNAYEIAELRGWLYETHQREEFYAPFKDIDKIKYGKIYEDYKNIIDSFCKKYNLTAMTD